jgi:hypothetical protein
MSSQDPVVLTRVALARAVKTGDRTAETCARRDYAAEKLAASIQRTVDEVPLTDEQVARLVKLLQPTAGGGRDA